MTAAPPDPYAAIRLRSIRQIAAPRGPTAPGVRAGSVAVPHRPFVLTDSHVPGTHWRWYTAPDATLDAETLGHRVVVAPTRRSVRYRL